MNNTISHNHRKRLSWLRWAPHFAAFLLTGACSGNTDELGVPGEAADTETGQSLSVSGAILAPTPVFGAFWSAGSGDQVIKLRLSRPDFVAEYDRQWGRNFRLKSMTVQMVNGIAEFSGVWVPSSAGQVLRLTRTYADFLADYDEWWNKGFRLSELRTNVQNGTVLYSGIWNPSTSGQYLRLNRDQATFLSEYSTRWNEGYRLISLTSDVVGGVVRYSGVWNPSTKGQYLRLGRLRDAFDKETATRAAEGYRLAAVDTYTLNHDTYYDAIYDPSSAAQIYTTNQPSDEFLATDAQRLSAGQRIRALIGEGVEGLAVQLLTNDMKYRVDGRLVGFALGVRAGNQNGSIGVGQRRTQVDGAQPMSPDMRMNLASVSKTITAIGVLQSLRRAGLTPDSKMWPYLPKRWTLGPNVKTITFRELLTHTSGLRPEGDTLEYTNLQKHIAKGIVLTDKVGAYRNTNFALFRVIIPYLNGFNDTGIQDANMPAEVSRRFLDYYNQNVFAPAGIPTVALKPSGSTRTLNYPWPAGNTRGIDYGDWTDAAGGAGWLLSSNEVARLLVTLNDGTLLPIDWVQQMDQGLLGWQGWNGSRHGGYYIHGGYFPPQPGELNTMALRFVSGVQMGVQVNSGIDSSLDLLWSLIDAHDHAWVGVD